MVKFESQTKLGTIGKVLVIYYELCYWRFYVIRTQIINFSGMSHMKGRPGFIQHQKFGSFQCNGVKFSLLSKFGQCDGAQGPEIFIKGFTNWAWYHSPIRSYLSTIPTYNSHL